MTVIDLSVLSAFWLGGTARDAAEDLYRRHPDWAAPVAWRSEFRRVLDTWVSFEQIDTTEADQIWNAVESQLAGREFFSGSIEVLELARSHGLSRFDAEVVAYAGAHGIPFHTVEPRLGAAFPDCARLLSEPAGHRPALARPGRKAA